MHILLTQVGIWHISYFFQPKRTPISPSSPNKSHGCPLTEIFAISILRTLVSVLL